MAKTGTLLRQVLILDMLTKRTLEGLKEAIGHLDWMQTGRNRRTTYDQSLS